MVWSACVFRLLPDTPLLLTVEYVKRERIDDETGDIDGGHRGSDGVGG
jgi:hypothetical protein